MVDSDRTCDLGDRRAGVHDMGEEQTMREDLIKRSDAIDELMHIIPYKRYHNGEYVFLLNKKECLAAIKTVPIANRSQETCLKEAEVLLKATRNLLNKQNESVYVLDMLEETVEYYGVECDGSCLIGDIDAWLELYGSEEGTDDE